MKKGYKQMFEELNDQELENVVGGSFIAWVLLERIWGSFRGFAEEAEEEIEAVAPDELWALLERPNPGLFEVLWR